jgi:NADP-dependent 3-hydroxy acid dehydrogenase YdfG
VLLARNPKNYEAVEKEINSNGGKAIGIPTDLADQESLKSAFSKIEQEFNGAPIAAAVYNASARPVRKPILEISVEDFEAAHAIIV